MIDSTKETEIKETVEEELEKSVDFALLETIKLSTNKEEVKKAYEAFYKKFERLIKGSYFTYRKLALEKGLKKYLMDFDEYKNYAFERMHQAITALKIEKIEPEKRGSWGFFIQFQNYLSAYDVSNSKKNKEKKRKETTFYLYNEDEKTEVIVTDVENYSTPGGKRQFLVEEDKEKHDFWEAVEKCKQILTPEELLIWEHRLKGTTLTVIRSRLNLTEYRYKQAIEEIKVKFQKCLSEVTKDANAYERYLSS